MREASWCCRAVSIAMCTSRSQWAGIVMADDFESGTRSAAFGGNTLIMPFCLQQKGESLRQAVKDYRAKAQANCYIDVSFHLIISDPSPTSWARSCRLWSAMATPRSRCS